MITVPRLLGLGVVTVALGGYLALVSGTGQAYADGTAASSSDNRANQRTTDSAAADAATADASTADTAKRDGGSTAPAKGRTAKVKAKPDADTTSRF